MVAGLPVQQGARRQGLKGGGAHAAAADFVLPVVVEEARVRHEGLSNLQPLPGCVVDKLAPMAAAMLPRLAVFAIDALALGVALDTHL